MYSDDSLKNVAPEDSDNLIKAFLNQSEPEELIIRYYEKGYKVDKYGEIKEHIKNTDGNSKKQKRLINSVATDFGMDIKDFNIDDDNGMTFELKGSDKRGKLVKSITWIQQDDGVIEIDHANYKTGFKIDELLKVFKKEDSEKTFSFSYPASHNKTTIKEIEVEDDDGVIQTNKFNFKFENRDSKIMGELFESFNDKRIMYGMLTVVFISVIILILKK